MWSFKAFIATIITAIVISIPMYFYWEFLTQGMRPPEGMQLLTKFEKDGFPDFTLPNLDGKPVSLNQFKGKIVLVNLWATWCSPCVKEFPALKNLAEHFKDNMIVVAVSHDSTREDIDTFIQTWGGVPENFVLLWDKEKKTDKLLGTDALPETYILNKDLKLVRKVAGEIAWDEAMSFRFFDEMIGP